jgi:hypothetical protein
MSAYRIYYVTTGRPKSGKSAVAGRWWAEKGRKLFESITKHISKYIWSFGVSFFKSRGKTTEGYPLGGFSRVKPVI